MSFRYDYRLFVSSDRPDAFDLAWMEIFERKRQEELLAEAAEIRRERERQQELQREQERQRQLELEQERQRQLELERERQRQLELQREQERQRQLELERERQRQLELERERQRQLELERERQRQLELERERQRQLELQREQERQRQLELEQERQRQLELERERQRQLELQREQERQRQLELERERQRQLELERERQRQLELERERQHQLELERERQRQLELERERQRQLELQREKERQRQLELERERQRQLELEQERQRQQELQQEQERQRQLELQRKQEQEQERVRLLEQEREQQREQLRAKEREYLIQLERSGQQETERVQQQERKRTQDQMQQQEEARLRDVQRTLQLSRLRLEEEREEEKKRKNKYPVVVVGCGASGIAALARLKEAGITAVGVEASNRMGGRIHTVNFGAGVVDLGAAWCHGESENIVFQLANPHGLLGRPEYKGNDQDWYLFSDGSIMPPGNAKAILKKIDKKVKANQNSKGSIREFVRTGVRNEEINAKPRKLPINEPFLRWYEQDNHLGGREDPLAAKSLKALTKQKICAGEFWLHWKEKGYKTLLDLLLRKIPATGTPLNVDIQYNKVVTNICWMIQEPDPDDAVPTVMVSFADGTSMKASRVIVTVPLGVLKQNYATMFTPLLHPNKIAAINSLQVYVLDTIVMEFEKAWWPEGMVNLRILWRNEDKKMFENENWVTGIYGFRTVEHRPKALLAWISGPHAEEMEKVRDDQLSKGIIKLIKHVFSVNFDVPMITKMKRSKWASNEFAKGSFSYRGVTSERCESASAEVLSEPLELGGVPVVCFAGEATSHNWHGHVHGAVEAGYREADRVIRSITQ